VVAGKAVADESFFLCLVTTPCCRSRNQVTFSLSGIILYRVLSCNLSSSSSTTWGSLLFCQTLCFGITVTETVKLMTLGIVDRVLSKSFCLNFQKDCCYFSPNILRSVQYCCWSGCRYVANRHCNVVSMYSFIAKSLLPLDFLEWVCCMDLFTKSAPGLIEVERTPKQTQYLPYTHRTWNSVVSFAVSNTSITARFLGTQT
jgi:hypothetical protein